MRAKIKSFLVIDLEATCWKGTPPKGQQSDIIEIGIAEIDVASLEITRSEGILIQPSRSEISEFCTQLTSISKETLKGAPDFNSAINYIRNEYAPKYKPWASWGGFDKKRLIKECPEKGTIYPFSEDHINAMTLYCASQGVTRRKGLKKALRSLDIQFEGTPHRGVDDAKNTAKLLIKLWKKSRNS